MSDDKRAKAHEAFYRVTGKRVEKLVDAFRVLGNVPRNPTAYYYTADDVDAMFNELAKAFRACREEYVQSRHYRETKVIPENNDA